jgi:hypothetical protein
VRDEARVRDYRPRDDEVLSQSRDQVGEVGNICISRSIHPENSLKVRDE